MSIKSCLDDMIANKLINKRQYDKLSVEATRIRNRLLTEDNTLTPDVAADQATRLAVEKLNEAVVKQHAALQYQTVKYNASVELVSKAKNPVRAIREQLRKVMYDKDAISGSLTAHMTDFIERMRAKIPGGFDNFFRANKALSEDIIRAMNGAKKVSKEAKELAEQILQARKLAVSRLANTGVRVHETGLNLTRNASPHNLLAAGKAKFTKDVFPLVDANNMYRQDGTLMTSKEIEDTLGKYFDELTSEERNFIGGNVNDNITSLDDLSINLKDAESHLQFFNLYGSGNLFDNVITDMDDLATKIALAENFGPKYKTTFRKLSKIQDEYVKNLPASKQNSQALKDFMSSNDAFYRTISSDLRGTPNQLLGSFIGGTKNFATASLLGKAVLSSLTDYNTINSTSKLLGLSSSKIFGKIFTDLISGSNRKATNKLATRLGQQINWTHGISPSVTRYGDMSLNTSFNRGTARAADFVVRSTGLSGLQHTNEKEFFLAMIGDITERRTTSWEKLPKKLRSSFEYANINKAIWDDIRQDTNVTSFDGVDWLDPTKMSNDASNALLGMTSKYVKMAVPSPDDEVRSIMTGGAKAGSLDREVRGLLTTFQGFNFSIALRNFNTLLFHPALNGPLNKFQYVGRLVIWGTVLGTISQQLFDVASGKDLTNWENPEIWIKGALRSSVFGIGFLPKLTPTELVKSSEQDFKDGLVPVAFDPLIKLFIGGKQALGHTVMSGFNLTKGETSDAEDEIIEAGRTIGKTLNNQKFIGHWATDLIIQRLITDKLNEIIDPNYGSSVRRTVTNLNNRTGQDFWWQPGDSAPQRLPEQGNKRDITGE